MRYKVTSKRDITILAYVPNNAPGEDKVAHPQQTSLMWVPVLAKKPADGLDRIVGIDPRCVQESNTVTEGHFTFVPVAVTGDDPSKEYFGLFKVEPSAVSD
jgi:hypothetical protein